MGKDNNETDILGVIVAACFFFIAALCMILGSCERQLKIKVPPQNYIGIRG